MSTDRLIETSGWIEGYAEIEGSKDYCGYGIKSPTKI